MTANTNISRITAKASHSPASRAIAKLEEKQRGFSLILICVGLVLLVPFVHGLVLNVYWDHEYVETYRGYDVYFFPTPYVYGIDTGEADASQWNFAASVEACEGLIDNWIDDPVFIEHYGGYDLYREPGGAQRYYAVNPFTGEKATAYWMDLDPMKVWKDENLKNPEPTPDPEPVPDPTPDPTPEPEPPPDPQPDVEPDPEPDWWKLLQLNPLPGLGIAGLGVVLYYTSRKRS